MATGDERRGPMEIVYASLHRYGQGEGATTHIDGITSGLLSHGVSVKLVAQPSGGAALRWLQVTLRARRLLRASRSGVLMVRAHPAAWPLVSWARRRDHRVVVELNGPFDDIVRAHPRWSAASVAFDHAERRVLAGATTVVAVTESLRDYARRRGSKADVLVLPNAADLDTFWPAPAPEGGRPYVAFCGALTQWQGIEVMLAATRSAAWPPSVELWIAGDGPLRNSVEGAVGEGRVRYLGRISRHEVAAVVREALAVVSPNTRATGHGSPIKLYEAVVSGVPILASDLPGQRELVAGADIGLVYPAVDPGALAKAVRKLFNDPVLRSAFVANAVGIREDHSWETRASELLAAVTQ